MIVRLLLLGITSISCQQQQQEFNTLFAVGGAGGIDNAAEFVSLQGLSCPTPAPHPVAPYGSVGTYIGNEALVCGGYHYEDGTSLNSCYAYSPSNDSWVPKAASMNVQRQLAEALQLSEDTWWVTGGLWVEDVLYEVLASTEIYRVGMGFEPYVDLPEARHSHNLVKINDTHVMLLGGQYPGNTKTWMFDLTTELWTELPDLLVPAGDSQAGFVEVNGQVVVTGGYGTEATQLYSLATNTWTFGDDFPTGNRWLQGACNVQYQDSLIVVGGYYYLNDDFDTIFQYIAPTERWEERVEKLDLARERFAAFLVPDDFVECG